MLNADILKKLKLIVFDLDGTLLNNDGVIPEITQNLIKELKKKDVHFTFASGRLHSALTRYAEELNLETPLISLDGSLIKSHSTNEIIFESYIPARYVKKGIRLANGTLTKFALCHADAIYYTEENSIIPEMLEKYGAVYHEVSSLDEYFDKTLELVFVGDIRENIKLIRQKFSFPYSFGLRHSYYKSHLFGGIYYLEIRKSGASKGDAVKKLAKRMKLKLDEVAVMGDWYNDRSLFETDALKIAMANAVPEIMRLADYVTKKDNHDGGVSEFLEMVLEAKNK